MSSDGTDLDGGLPEGAGRPSDLALLAAIADLWQRVDPPPTDLADGVLARLAAEDLEFELLTLVEATDALAGVRHAAPEESDAGAWALEYEGPDFHVYVRLSRIEDHTRVDGWIVPALPLGVQLRTEGHETTLETEADEFGRFEFARAPSGVSRLGFLAGETDSPARPRITPPFWI